MEDGHKKLNDYGTGTQLMSRPNIICRRWLRVLHNNQRRKRVMWPRLLLHGVKGKPCQRPLKARISHGNDNLTSRLELIDSLLVPSSASRPNPVSI